MRGEVVMYRTDDGKIGMGVWFAGETVWLTQAQMVDLFGRERSVITKHIRNVFVEGELKEKGNVQKTHIASAGGKVSISSVDEPYYRKRLIGIVRVADAAPVF